MENEPRFVGIAERDGSPGTKVPEPQNEEINSDLILRFSCCREGSLDLVAEI